MSELSDITKYHQLVSKKVRPEQLLLDPSNPRINVDVDLDHHYTNDEILSESIQNDILRTISKNEYRVSELKRGISQHGFLSGAEPLIVERIDGEDKYLVLEGNRRTSAVKSLLLDPKSNLSETVRKTLEIIEVKEFRYVENPKYTRDEIVDILLGTIHLTGKVAWGAMEKAHYIFKSYMRELQRSTFSGKLKIDEGCVGKLSEVFNTPKSEIRKSIWVYSVYQQLTKNGYKPESKKFSLIEMAIANRDLRKNYFEMDSTCHFSDLGMERFNTLCIEDGCPVSNPDDFKKFQYVYRTGGSNHVSEIENGAPIGDVYDRVKSEKEESKIYDKLLDILDRLKSLNVSGFTGEDGERRVVEQISRVVQYKLLSMVEDEVREPTPDPEDYTEEWFYPNTVSELCGLKSWQIQEIVKEVLKKKPNSTCKKDALSTLILRFLQIRTTGTPRTMAEAKINFELQKMVSNGLVEEYHGGTNDRIRLLTD